MASAAGKRAGLNNHSAGRRRATVFDREQLLGALHRKRPINVLAGCLRSIPFPFNLNLEDLGAFVTVLWKISFSRTALLRRRRHQVLEPIQVSIRTPQRVNSAWESTRGDRRRLNGSSSAKIRIIVTFS
jgi:hypothetical protein